jgi:predicted nucleotidyltransferase
MFKDPNLQILELAVERLGPLADEMVFLGGCATGLLLTDPGAPPVRATRDVDVIVEVATLGEYHRLSVRLRQRGFREDQDPDAPICRWTMEGLLLDVMPTSAAILGFGNEWYRPALKEAVFVELPSGNRIRMVTAPHFLATKLAAFTGRGEGDYLMSHDLEDIVAVLDGRPEVVDEVDSASIELRQYLLRHFARLIGDDAFLAALPGHLASDTNSSARVQIVVDRIQKIAAAPS